MLGVVFVVCAILVSSIGFAKESKILDQIEKSISVAIVQYELMLDELEGEIKYPRSVNAKGETHFVSPDDWTSGFFPGTMWYLYELTGNERFKDNAEHYTEGLEEIQFDSTTHDLGFVMYCSYGNAYRITGKKEYLEILDQTSATLCKRFNENTGCIRSWDFGQWQFPVIIDNMMNLELLFAVGKLVNNKNYINVANSHAKTTLLNHFRNDYSSFHVVNYDTINGSIISKETFQGLSDDSKWARGQAWGLYGYTMSFNETSDIEYLKHAEKIAEYIMGQLKEQIIPNWDFCVENKLSEPRDASAAAIMCSAFLDLHKISGKKKSKYLKYAELILKELTSEKYLAKEGSNNNFILMHSTGHKPHNSEIDVPLNYADYYFIEAIKKYKQLFGSEKQK